MQSAIQQESTGQEFSSANYVDACGHSWEVDCVGNGVTIRNLQKALTEAQSIIVNLRTQSSSASDAYDKVRLKEMNAALEKKLVQEQTNTANKDMEISLLQSQISQYEVACRKMIERTVSMIKENCWQLPDQSLVSNLSRADYRGPVEAAEHMMKLLETLESVNQEVLLLKKKELDNQAHSNLLMNQQDIAITKKQLMNQEARNQELLQEIKQLRDMETEFDVKLMKLTQQNAEMRACIEAKSARSIVELEAASTSIFDLEKRNRALTDEVQELKKTIEKESDVKLSSIKAKVIQATNTETMESVDNFSQTSPRVDSDANQTISLRTSLKRPLSPTFGLDQVATTDEDLYTAVSQESVIVDNTSPTPHLDELFVGSINRPVSIAPSVPSPPIPNTPIGERLGGVARRIGEIFKPVKFSASQEADGESDFAEDLSLSTPTGQHTLTRFRQALDNPSGFIEGLLTPLWRRFYTGDDETPMSDPLATIIKPERITRKASRRIKSESPGARDQKLMKTRRRSMTAAMPQMTKERELTVKRVHSLEDYAAAATKKASKAHAKRQIEASTQKLKTGSKPTKETAPNDVEEKKAANVRRNRSKALTNGKGEKSSLKQNESPPENNSTTKPSPAPALYPPPLLSSTIYNSLQGKGQPAARVTRGRRKAAVAAVARLENDGETSQSNSAPATPLVDAERRRSKRSKVAKSNI